MMMSAELKGIYIYLFYRNPKDFYLLFMLKKYK